MKALILWWDEESWPLAREALRTAGRSDLIGLGPNALVPPAHHKRPFAARGAARQRAR